MNYNPYAAPQAPATPPPPAGGFGAPQPWTAGDALGIAWARFKVHGGVLIVAHVVFSLLTGVLAQIPSVLSWTRVLDPKSPAYFALLGASYLVTQVLSAFFQVGLARIWLDAARGTAPRFETLFSGADRFLPMLGLNVIFGVALCLGCALLIVPGVLVAITYQIAPYYVVEGRMGPIQALQRAWEVSSGQRGELFVLSLAGVGLGILGVAMCCMGLMVTVPLYWVATAVAFTRAAGMAVAPVDPGPPQPPYGGNPPGLPPWR